MKISIITVCYNSEKTIKDTFESLLKQTYNDYQYIIIDGKSTDNTIKLIEEYKLKFEAKGIEVKFVSEKDKGLFDAMNKGIKLATGDIVGIINSDDIIYDVDAFKKIIKRFEEDKCDATYSDLYIMDSSLQKVNRVFIAGRKSYKIGWYPPHPTLYVKKEIYDKFGMYNLKYKIAADYDFMIRIMKNNIKMSYIKEVLIYMRAGGTSTSSLKAYKKSFDEAVLILKQNNIKFPYLVNIRRTLVIIKQRIRGILKIK